MNDTETRSRKRPPRARSAPSRGTPPRSDGDGSGAVAYEDLFGTPALVTLSDEEIYERVRRFARQRPAVVRRASQDGRRDFWEAGNPFDYDVTAEEAGGQGHE